MTSCGSVPGTRTATSTFITSSSRGGELRSGGVRSHLASSSSPPAVIRLQRLVDLPHVQRPDLAGPGLELLAKLQAVLGTLAQQREHRVADTHDLPLLDIMSSNLLSIALGHSSSSYRITR